MMSYPKIPDEIFENRCKHCMFHIQGKENRKIQNNEIYMHKDNPCPCKIQSIAGYFHQISHDEDRIDSYENVPYEDGECRSFAPNFGYAGICESCTYYNVFDDDACTIEPLNRHRAFIGNNDVYHECNSFAYFSCDRWKAGHWGYIMVEQAAKGLIPSNFDPDTLKLVSKICINSTADKWTKLKEKVKTEQMAVAKEIELRKVTDSNGQISLF